MPRSCKAYWLISLVVLSLGGLSCGGTYFSGVRTGYSGANRPGHIYGSYASFDGSERNTFSVTEGQTIAINYSATINNGSLTFILRDANEGELWRVDLQSDGADSTTVIAPNSGDYTMIIVGEDTGGSYDVTWEVK